MCPNIRNARKYISFTMLAVFLFVIWIQVFNKKIEIDKSNFSQKLIFKNATRIIQKSDGGLKVICNKQCVVFTKPFSFYESREISKAYITIFYKMKKSAPPPFMIIPYGDKRYIPRQGMKGSDRTIFNMRHTEFWKRTFPITFPVKTFGLVFHGEFELSKISISRYLGLMDYFKSFFHNFTTPEPFLAYSINMQQGVHVLSLKHNLLLGIIFLIVLIIILIVKRKNYLRSVLVTFFVFFLVSDVPWIMSVTDYLKKSLEISALHYERNEEYGSRLGKDFSIMTDKILQLIPDKAKVYATKSYFKHISMESNMIEFLFKDSFNFTTSPGQADYIIVYNPSKGLWSGNKGVFILEKQKIQATEIFRIKNQVLLKVAK